MKWFLLANWILTFAGCGVGFGILVTSIGSVPDAKLSAYAVAVVLTPLAWAWAWSEVWKLVKPKD